MMYFNDQHIIINIIFAPKGISCMYILLCVNYQLSYNYHMTSEALEYYLEGKEDSKELVIFLQGWPDNNQVWEPLEWNQNLADKRLLFINFPNTTKTQPHLKWGQDFPVIVDRIKATLDEVGLHKFEKKIIVSHDWGCFYSYNFDQKYPKTVDQIIALDVPAYVTLAGLKPILYVLAYQITLLVAFLLGGSLGRFITQLVCRVFRYRPKYLKEIDGSRNYPYYYLYRNKIISLFNKSKGYLYRYRPSVPIVYVYAQKKPFQFHGEKWLNYLRESEGCETHSLEVNHWIMNKYASFLTDLIRRRLK